MMKRFDILSRDLKVHEQRVLEASAGTGKTYSIEHLVVRLLMESADSAAEPLRLPQILIMTYTRAATRELKMRIRQNIGETVDLLSKEGPAPDYVSAVREQGAEACQAAIKRLQRALAMYDEAQVFTIHGFCARMLRECQAGSWISSEGRYEDPKLSKITLLEVIRNVFRTELRPDKCSPGQLQRLLSDNGSSIHKLEHALLRDLEKGLPIVSTEPFSKHLHDFRKAMETLKVRYGLEAEKIRRDAETRQNCFTKTPKESWEEISQKISRFAGLFEKDHWMAEDLDQLIIDDVVMAKAYVGLKKNKDSSKVIASLNYPELLNNLKEVLVPIVDAARSPERIHALVAHECKKLVDRYIEEEELSSSNQLLRQMAFACEDELFRQRVSARFRYVIVDEFQDTDPLQWGIFQTLFRSQTVVPMAVVGDPKQAIYSFRQADVQTYFEAVESFPQEQRASLDTNFRSCPELVAAVNWLFSPENSPGLLPRGYRAVQANPNAHSHPLKDGKRAIHFVVAEEKGKAKDEAKVLLPYVTQEIRSLHSQGYAYRDIAILVRDRYQRKKALDSLREADIPAVLERSGYVTDSPAFAGMAEVLSAFLHPREASAVLQALGSVIVGMTHAEARAFLESHDRHNVIDELHLTLKERGIAPFMEALLQQDWRGNGATLLEDLLRRDNGVELYRDMRKIAELLAEAQCQRHVRPEGLLQEMHELQLLAIDEEDKLLIQEDSQRDAVRILTMHVSKGLEFGVVFAIGLVKRAGGEEKLIPTERKNSRLVASADHPLELKRYQREGDEEKVRQAYVAMTRAKDRLYIPVYLLKDAPNLGAASPLELILAHLGKPAPADQDEVYERVKALSPEHVMTLLKESAPEELFSSKWNVIEQEDSEHVSEPSRAVLIPPEFIPVPGPDMRLHSFTSLLADEDVPQGDVGGLRAPADPAASVKTIHTLPAGPDTGVLLHKLLQDIPLHEMAFARVAAELVGEPLEPWNGVIAGLLTAAVRTPLSLAEGEVPLCGISPHLQYREMEFVYPVEEVEALGLNFGGKGFIKGVIDLVFFHEGKYYLIDWKSNWLGPDAECYVRSNLEAVMARHHYHLQARLYTEALRRYVRLFDATPFEQLFGGAFYLFLRGMDPEKPHQGVYAFNPLEASLCLE